MHKHPEQQATHEIYCKIGKFIYIHQLYQNLMQCGLARMLSGVGGQSCIQKLQQEDELNVVQLLPKSWELYCTLQGQNAITFTMIQQRGHCSKKLQNKQEAACLGFLNKCGQHIKQNLDCVVPQARESWQQLEILFYLQTQWKVAQCCQ